MQQYHARSRESGSKAEWNRRPPIPLVAKISLLAILGVAITACGVVGPGVIRAGRGVYAASISRTNDEQVLSLIVRARYGESYTQLAVTSVTANVRVKTAAGINLGFGSEEDFAGNLVPFSGEVTYEENPTITYSPVQGREYLRELLSPVPLDLLVPMLRSYASSEQILTLMVREINGHRNPEFLYFEKGTPDPGFGRVVELITLLIRAGELDFIIQPERNEFSLIIRWRPERYSSHKRDLLELLGISTMEGKADVQVIPIKLSLYAPWREEIDVLTRSIFDIFQILAASVDVPEDHHAKGISRPYPPLGLAGEDLHIRRADSRPLNASVAVRYQGHWFYIDETDQTTKSAFHLVQTLWYAQTASTGRAVQAAPVLTVPVSN